MFKILFTIFNTFILFVIGGSNRQLKSTELKVIEDLDSVVQIEEKIESIDESAQDSTNVDALEKPIETTSNQINVVKENNQNNLPSKEETKNTDKKTNVPIRKESNVSNNTIVPNKSQEIPKVEEKVIIQEKNESEELKQNNKTDIAVEKTTSEAIVIDEQNQSEIKSEKVVEETKNIDLSNDGIKENVVDEEYNKLKESTAFSTFEECRNFKPNVPNLRNTLCETVSYNYELIGYKMTIFYKDGSYEVYKNN